LPTGPEPVSIRQLRRARTGRRIAVTILVAFVVAGLGGVFGYRTGTVERSGGGYDLRLSYPAVGRPGVPIQWILHVHRDGGLPREVTIATSIGYLDLLDLNGIEPEPNATTTTADEVLWTFTAPEGEDMTVILDALVSTNAHRGVRAVTKLVKGGAEVVSVSYETRVAP